MRIKSTPMTWYIILLVVTSIMAIVVPASPSSLHAFHVTEEVYRLLIVSLLVPYALIWFAAFYGYDQLAKYSNALKYTGEGKAFKKIAIGLGVLAWGLVLEVTLALLLSTVSLGHPGFKPAQVITTNYFDLLVALAGFTFIESGTYELTQLIHAHYSHTTYRWLVVLSAAIGALFQHFIFLNQANSNSHYIISTYPLIFTIIVPYIFMWTIAIVSIYQLNLYATKVRGLLYKRALKLFANGLTIIILLSVVAQFISASSAGKSNTLGSTLLYGYILLGAVALGFVLVALGAKHLKRIEEV